MLHVCDYDWPWMPGNSKIMYYKILFDMHYLFVMGFSKLEDTSKHDLKVRIKVFYISREIFLLKPH